MHTQPDIDPCFDPVTSTITYVVSDPATRDCVIIDPVLDYDPQGSQTSTGSLEQVMALIDERALSVRFILETHPHADHLSGAQILRQKYGAPLAIGQGICAVQRVFKTLFAPGLGADFATDGSQFDRLLVPGEVLQAGSLAVRVIGTPGHTPACVSYHIGDAVFTGDALFMEEQGTGRCDFPLGSAATLYDSIHGVLYALPDETRVFPAHDYCTDARKTRLWSTIGVEKAKNVQLRGETTREDYVRFRTTRDATLTAPRLLYQSVQVNIAAGKLPAARDNGHRYLTMPLNLTSPTDDLGNPITKK